jgi:hypothetical protein
MAYSLRSSESKQDNSRAHTDFYTHSWREMSAKVIYWSSEASSGSKLSHMPWVAACSLRGTDHAFNWLSSINQYKHIRFSMHSFSNFYSSPRWSSSISSYLSLKLISYLFPLFLNLFFFRSTSSFSNFCHSSTVLWDIFIAIPLFCTWYHFSVYCVLSCDVSFVRFSFVLEVFILFVLTFLAFSWHLFLITLSILLFCLFYSIPYFLCPLSSISCYFLCLPSPVTISTALVDSVSKRTS